MKTMAKIETSLKDTKELRQLIIDNPYLPLVIFAGEDSWHDFEQIDSEEIVNMIIEES